VGGAIVDRLPRRNVILATDLASGLVVGTLAILGATRSLQIWHLYVASAFFGVAFSFYMPAMSAIMPELVPKDILIAGNSLRSLSGQGAQVGGRFWGEPSWRRRGRRLPSGWTPRPSSSAFWSFS